MVQNISDSEVIWRCIYSIIIIIIINYPKVSGGISNFVPIPYRNQHVGPMSPSLVRSSADFHVKYAWNNSPIRSPRLITVRRESCEEVVAEYIRWAEAWQQLPATRKVSVPKSINRFFDNKVIHKEQKCQIDDCLYRLLTRRRCRRCWCWRDLLVTRFIILMINMSDNVRIRIITR